MNKQITLMAILIASVKCFGQSVTILPENTIESNINVPLIFKTNGLNRLQINNSGKIGIGSLNPIAQLHITNGLSGVTPSSGTFGPTLFLERNGHTYLEIASPDDKERGLAFSNPTDGTSGGIYYSSKNMYFRTNTNDTRMAILSSGNVGIGTNNPESLLHLHQPVNPSTSQLRITNSFTGLGNSDGFLLGYNGNTNSARLMNLENGVLNIGTNNIEAIKVSSFGEILIPSTLAVGESLGNAYKLAVVGDTYLQGDVNVSSLIGTSTKPVNVTNEGKLVRGSTPISTNTYTKYHTVSAANTRMIGLSAATNFTYMATACLAYLSTGVKYGDAQLILPVEFPDDATITEITLNAIDNVTYSYMIAKIMKVPKIGIPTSQGVLDNISTEFMPQSPDVQAVSKSTNLPIENNSNYYYIIIDINSGGSNWGDVGLALRGLTFKYSITY